MEKYWRDAVLENVPHGEEGHLQLSLKDAFQLTQILLNRGYAVCLTGGDTGDDIAVHWIYAGTGENLEWSNYDQVVFTSIDYLEDYPEAQNEDTEEDVEEEDE